MVFDRAQWLSPTGTSMERALYQLAIQIQHLLLHSTLQAGQGRYSLSRIPLAARLRSPLSLAALQAEVIVCLLLHPKL